MIGDTDLKVSKLYGMLPADLEGTSEGRTPVDNQTFDHVANPASSPNQCRVRSRTIRPPKASPASSSGETIDHVWPGSIVFTPSTTITP